jgi:hypothetical protein
MEVTWSLTPMSMKARNTVKDWQHIGRAAATSRRSRIARLVRLVRYRLVKLALRVRRALVSHDVTASWFEYQPAALSAIEHADISARAGWYLGGLRLPVQTEGPPYEPGDAPWMQGAKRGPGIN